MGVVGRGTGVGPGVTCTGAGVAAADDGAADIEGSTEGEGTGVAAEHPDIAATRTAITSGRVPRLEDGRAVRFAYVLADTFLLLEMAGRYPAS